jgi:hypothetical protein
LKGCPPGAVPGIASRGAFPAKRTPAGDAEQTADLGTADLNPSGVTGRESRAEVVRSAGGACL